MRIRVVRIALYAIAFAAVVILGQFVIELRQAATNEARLSLRAEAAAFTQTVQNEVRLVIEQTRAVAALFESSDVVNEREYSRFIIRSGFLASLSRVRAIAAIPLLHRDEIPAFNTELRKREELRAAISYIPFTIAPDGARQKYAPVIYVETHDNRDKIVGYDIATSPERWRTAQAALLSAQPHMTPPVSLSQDDANGQKSVLILAAAKSQGNMGLRDFREPRADKTTFIASSYSPSLAVRQTIEERPNPVNFGLRVADITDHTAIEIYSSKNFDASMEPAFTDRLVHGNRVWALHYYPMAKKMPLFVANRFMLLGAIGGVLILALAVALDRFLKTREELEKQVHERTEQLRSVNKALVETARQANAESDAKSQFLAHMSHELRTPLNAVIGYSQMLGSEIYGRLGDPQYVEYAKTIEQAGKIQLQLVEDILSLTAIQGGQRELEHAPVQLVEIAEQCIDFVRKRAEDGNIEIKVISLLGEGKFVGDARSMHQIMLNLLSNAIKFTEPGGSVTVKIGRDNRGTVSVAVEDTGVGIAPEYIDKVLQPFGQAGGNPYNTHEGVGLGLSIVTSLAEACGGTVRLESEPRKGTVVTVEFPLTDNGTVGMNVNNRDIGSRPPS